MAEIVCPHCHASVPQDGAFCPQCRSFIGRAAADEEYEPAVAVAVAGTGEDDIAAVSSSRPGAARAAVAKDLFEEAVRSSMATSTRTRGRTVPDEPDEPDDDEPDPYPSDTELTARKRRRGRTPTPRVSGEGQEPSALARAIVWLAGLPARTRTLARKLGPMPVTVAIVVLALLASGGLLYSVGAFDGHATGQRPARHAAAVHVLTPSTYSASCSAPASVDSAGNRVTFGAGHLVDGKTSTAWRCPGDGHKQRVTLTFAKPVQVTQVALVPGWATKDRTSKANRFAENGAPKVVTWYVGTTPVKQRLGTPQPRWAVQKMRTPITSRTVTLTIDDVRKGNRRAMVAVSEIRVYGR